MQAKAMQGMAAATYPPFVIGTFNETLTVRPAGPAPDPRACVSTNWKATGKC
jgi:hypothetical protein